MSLAANCLPIRFLLLPMATAVWTEQDETLVTMLPRFPSWRCAWIRKWRRSIACVMCLALSDTAPARCVIAGKSVRVLDAATAECRLARVRLSLRQACLPWSFRWHG